jgi:hypothetical protein
VLSRPRRPGAAGFFPARPWLVAVMVLLVLEMANPNTYSLKAGGAQLLLYLAVMSPAFWAGEALWSPRQFRRAMALLFLCNAASAGVGLAQVIQPGSYDVPRSVYNPGPFDPPDIPALRGKYSGVDLTVERADGRRVLRPCGLTDTPGGAAQAGMVAALLGLSWAVRPIRWWKRVGAALLAFAGVAAIYYTYVRFAVVVLIIALGVQTSLLASKGLLGSALTIVGGGVGVLIGAMLWASRSLGTKVITRFLTLLGGSETYYRSRGFFITDVFDNMIWKYPLGAGLGWWGMINVYFGDPLRPGLWAEVMIPAWVLDGGLPLLFLYSMAILFAMWDTARVALTSPDRDVAFWASVIVAMNLGIAAACFSYIPFLAPLGVQFWLFAPLVHAADAQARSALARRPNTGGGPRPGRRPPRVA